jgi:hypothetical protein
MVSTFSPQGEKHVYRKVCHVIVLRAIHRMVVFPDRKYDFLRGK